MLLTGFDAPIEQVMYISKKIREHNLLQAIARVNRVAEGKSKGFIVDYIGIGNHLKEALEIYASDDREDIIESMKDISTEIPILQDRYQRLLNIFLDHGVSRIREYVEFEIKDPQEQFDVLEKAIEILEDVEIRANFDVFLKNFLKSLDVIFPNPIGNKYVPPARAFGHIHNRARNRYKDDSISLAGVGNKVKKLIDEHLISLGINPVVPPVELLSKDFYISIKKHTTKRAAASEMEHAIRKHIKVNLEYDPVYYEKLSEKLQKILEAHKDDVKVCFESLMKLFEEIKAGRKEGEDGLDTKIEMPFYDLLVNVAFDDKDIPDDTKEIVKTLIKESVKMISERTRLVDFWKRAPEQDSLKRELRDILVFSDVDEIINTEEEIITEFMALAKRKRDELAGYNA